MILGRVKIGTASLEKKALMWNVLKVAVTWACTYFEKDHLKNSGNFGVWPSPKTRLSSGPKTPIYIGVCYTPGFLIKFIFKL